MKWFDYKLHKYLNMQIMYFSLNTESSYTFAYSAPEVRINMSQYIN